MAKRTWNTSVAPVTEKAPNSHVSPKRNITPMTPKRSLAAVLISIFLFCRIFERHWCLKITEITITNTMQLKRIIANIGPRNAPKKTAVFPMKQLQKCKVRYFWYERGIYVYNSQVKDWLNSVPVSNHEITLNGKWN